MNDYHLTEMDIVPFIIMHPSEIDHQTTHGVDLGDTASMAPGDFLDVGPLWTGCFPQKH